MSQNVLKEYCTTIRTFKKEQQNMSIINLIVTGHFCPFLAWWVFWILPTTTYVVVLNCKTNSYFHKDQWCWTCLSAVQSFSSGWIFVTPWTAASQASLSITNTRSLLKLMSIKVVIPSNHFILCHPLILPPSIFPSIRVFSNELVLCIRWPKYWSFSFKVSPSNEHPGLISFRMD